MNIISHVSWSKWFKFEVTQVKDVISCTFTFIYIYVVRKLHAPIVLSCWINPLYFLQTSSETQPLKEWSGPASHLLSPKTMMRNNVWPLHKQPTRSYDGLQLLHILFRYVGRFAIKSSIHAPPSTTYTNIRQVRSSHLFMKSVIKRSVIMLHIQNLTI